MKRSEMISDWRNTVKLPIITNPEAWSLEKLEEILTESIVKCAKKCADDNKRIILTTLSGGLDSSLCCAIIQKVFRYEIPIYAFTIGTARHPDLYWAKEVAKALCLTHCTIFPSYEKIQAAVQTRLERPELFRGDPPEGLSGIGVFLLYELIWQAARDESVTIISHDGIDELLGGYWEHRKYDDSSQKEEAFRRLWAELPKKHLIPLTRKADHFGIKVIFPYLQPEVIKYISQIPIEERTNREMSKIPLREIAQKYLPTGVIERQKLGFCDALDREKTI